MGEIRVLESFGFEDKFDKFVGSNPVDELEKFYSSVVDKKFFFPVLTTFILMLIKILL